MKLSIFAFAASVTAQGTHYLYGPQWGWYSMKTSGFITELETTLLPNAPPSPAQTRLAIWPGMNTARGLIQPIIVSSDEALFQGAGCGGATKSQWCVFASMITSTQKAGKRVPMNGNDALNMRFKWNETLGGYNQWLSIKGKVVSELHMATGKAKSFYIDTECQAAHKGTVNNHTYTDTKFTLSEPAPGLDKQITMHYLACADSVTSSDGGKSWTIPNIKVEKSEAPKQYATSAKVGAAGGICGK
ncbi:hypothetical protein BT63DRAFT_456597 [Microthyrium microscopicum]|uniref:Concanavalin A-like lectin/glucanase n=1 Tax=Microthyrium microscopicum TaxID=703497 RepID=A0A6A6U8S5_9PEZI|nr:hypothetical protein BT63DRAFT_456597 [Microthyrium microscopicum]